jgi:hypothetical protein
VISVLTEGFMRTIKTLAVLAAAAVLLSFAPVLAQTSGSSEFPVAKGQAELSSLGVRIAILLQKFDDPSSFEPKTAVAFSEYGRSGTSYFYENSRYACRVNIGFNNVLPALVGYVIENVECCTVNAPFNCKTYSKRYGSDQ